MNAEEKRLAESNARARHWKRWGPYLSERAWGTVREDYSRDGSAWEYFPHDHARSRAYRWNEDGLAGISNRQQNICFSIALWNGNDPILKERLFGLTGNEGNHGEDVKEIYYYLDSTPTHSYMKYLYKYPQAAFPYEQLVVENRNRTKLDREFELIDTGIFDENKYFDVLVEYAKVDVDDVLIRITVENRGESDAAINVLPTIWARNDWVWSGVSPTCKLSANGDNVIAVNSDPLGERFLFCEGAQELLFTENETNNQRLFGSKNSARFVKDGINDYVVNGKTDAVNREQIGTKASANYHLVVPGKSSANVRLRLRDKYLSSFDDFDRVFERRISEADEFYGAVATPDLSDDARNVQRQAFSGMLWSKQFYHYVCGMGPRVPLYPAGRHRSGDCQGTAHPHAPRMVHASEWPDTGIRMGLWRRESAGPCVGGGSRLPDRQKENG